MTVLVQRQRVLGAGGDLREPCQERVILGLGADRGPHGRHIRGHAVEHRRTGRQRLGAGVVHHHIPADRAAFVVAVVGLGGLVDVHLRIGCGVAEVDADHRIRDAHLDRPRIVAGLVQHSTVRAGAGHVEQPVIEASSLRVHRMVIQSLTLRSPDASSFPTDLAMRTTKETSML